MKIRNLWKSCVEYLAGPIRILTVKGSNLILSVGVEIWLPPISQVIYGNEVLSKMNGCKFHFNQSVQRQMRTLDETHRTKVYSLTNELLYATTPEAYRKTHVDLYLFLNVTQDQVKLVTMVE